MAQTSQVLRVIYMPLGTDGVDIQNLLTLPALITAANNGWFIDLYATISVYGYQAPPGSMAVTKYARVDILTTSANDANLVATSLPALQSELGLSSPLITWSLTVTEGY